MNTTVITKKNKCLLDEDIVISYEKEYPYTIFGQVYEKNNGYLEANGCKLHILVYEYYNGVIPIDCEIHHINKNKKDNRLQNLQLMDKFKHRSLHNTGVLNPAYKNKKSDLPYGFSYSDKLKNDSYTLIFQYFNNQGDRKHIYRTRIDELVNDSINILTLLKKDYSKEIQDIKQWAQNNNLAILTFEKLEKNNLPKGCTIRRRNNKKIYEFYHPSQKYLGGSIDFNKALSKAICNTDDELYKQYLIDKWSKESYNE